MKYCETCGSPIGEDGYITDPSFIEVLNKVRKQNQSLTSALRELIELKDMKDSLDKLSAVDYLKVEADYRKRKPLAWIAAREVLK